MKKIEGDHAPPPTHTLVDTPPFLSLRINKFWRYDLPEAKDAIEE